MATYSRVRLYTMRDIAEILEMPHPTVMYNLTVLGIKGEMHDSPNIYGPRKIRMFRGSDIKKIEEYQKKTHPTKV